MSIDNKGNFQGGYFVVNQNRKNILWNQQNDFFVTLPYEQSIKSEVIKLIRESRKSIKICSFILTDKEILKEIERALDNYKVAVFILTQLDDSKFSSSLLSEEEMFDNFNQIHLDAVKRLYSKGAHVRATKTAHAKFVISDRKKILLMSANITTPSLTNNPETAILINDDNTSKHLDRLFDLIFQHGTEYTQFITASSNKQFIVSRKNNIHEKSIKPLNSSNLRFTYEDINQSLYNELVNIIIKATSDIYISTYSIVRLEYLPEFVNAIKSKIEEGKSVYIFSRGMNYRTDHIANCSELAQIGCNIYGDVYNHSKGIITNNSSMIFTANIDGNHGLKNGFEVGVLLEENQEKNLKAFIQWQIESAPYIFSLSPSKKDYFKFYSYYCNEKGINPMVLPQNLTIILKQENNHLISQIDSYPCYISVKNNKIAQIQIGNYKYEASFDNDVLSIGKKINYQNNMESYLLQYERLNIIIK